MGGLDGLAYQTGQPTQNPFTHPKYLLSGFVQEGYNHDRFISLICPKVHTADLNAWCLNCINYDIYEVWYTHLEKAFKGNASSSEMLCKPRNYISFYATGFLLLQYSVAKMVEILKVEREKKIVSLGVNMEFGP